MTENNKPAEIVDIPESAVLPAQPPAKRSKSRPRHAKPGPAPIPETPEALFDQPKAKKPRAKKAARGKRAASRRRQAARSMTVAVTLLLTAGIVAMLGLAGLLIYRHSAFLEMKRVVEAQTFYDGTTVEGIDVSGHTLSAALEYWQQRVEPKYAERAVQVADVGTVTARDMGYHSDYESVLYSAWSAGRRGSLEERYHQAVSRRYAPMAWRVDRALWTDETLDGYVSTIAAQVDTPAVDAAIQAFDVNTYAFQLTESQAGRQLDAESLKRDIAEALNAGGGSVEVRVETLEPQITREDVTSEYGMIAYAVTNASSSSSNRIKNIQNAVSLINGYRLPDGATFSFNEVVGERTTDRGFRRAPAYSGGEVTEEVGGGICQVSTTLFNAAVKSDMEIVERHNHSLTVAYVDKGKDAAVNWKSQDLRFTNHSGDDVYICCFVTEDKRVRFALFGRLLPNGETITLEGRTTDTIKYDTEYVESAFLMPGETKVSSQGKNGYKAEAYKIRWDASGNQLSKELLCKSVYKARNEVIQFGR